MSVSFDGSKNNDKALSFLKEKDADFANYRIDDSDLKTLQEKWEATLLPSIRVYNRDGTLKGAFDDYKEVIPVVKELVANSK